MVVEIVPFVAQLVSGLAVDIAAGTMRSLLYEREDVIERAIAATSSRFPELEGAKTALEQWASGEAFARFCERVHAGERELDEQIVQSFVVDGQFYHPDAEEQSRLAGEVVSVFLSELVGAWYRSDAGIVALSNRFEARHEETERRVIRPIESIEAIAMGNHALLSSIAKAVGADSSAGASPLELSLTAQIGQTRKLINSGRIEAARILLQRIHPEAKAVSPSLEFRVLTNLGACALAEEDFDGAREFFEEAYRLQPESQKAMTNGAIAAI